MAYEGLFIIFFLFCECFGFFTLDIFKKLVAQTSSLFCFPPLPCFQHQGYTRKHASQVVCPISSPASNSRASLKGWSPLLRGLCLVAQINQRFPPSLGTLRTWLIVLLWYYTILLHVTFPCLFLQLEWKLLKIKLVSSLSFFPLIYHRGCSA